MKLSIITINFNNLAGLQRTYDSVVCQTWTDYEWIVIDGGSTDGSREFIEEHKDKFAYWCSEPDKGIYNAMNKGIAKAKGEYLLFLNSGDCLHAFDVFEKVSKYESRSDIIYGDLNFKFQYKERVFHYPKTPSTHYFLFRSLGHPSSFIRTELLKTDGYREDFKIISDWYKFVKWFREGRKFEHIDVIVSDFDTTGISNTNGDLLKNEANIMYDELFGVENTLWIKESIEMQKMFERYSNEDITGALRICNRNGKRKSILHLIIKLLNKTF